MRKNTNLFESLDFVRGIAIGLMFIYHFCFGLSQLGYLQVSFSTDLFWIAFRTLIIFLFLSLVGIGLHLASRKRILSVSYFKRLALLFSYFSLITLLSYLVRPNHFVYFGILHLIFLSSIIGPFFLPLYWLNLILGVSCLIIGTSSNIEAFDSAYIVWLGLSQSHPASDDFAPFFPWFGFVLIGIFIGKTLFLDKKNNLVYNWKAENLTSKLLCWAGRQSIHLYFVHFQFFYILVYLFS